MTTIFPFPSGLGGVAVTRGRLSPVLSGGAAFGLFRFPTDAIGIFTLRFRNLVEGSRVRVEAADDGTTLDEFVATADTVQERTLSLYASGNSLNEIRIKVRNASGAPAYRPFESQAVAQNGVVTIFVFQEPDE